MKIEKEQGENNEFLLEDFNLFGEFINIVLAGYVLFSIFLAIFFLKYLFSKNHFFSIFTGGLLIINIWSIRSAIKSTSSKKIKLLEKVLQIEYVIFDKVLIKKLIPWESISNCMINEKSNLGEKNEKCQLLLLIGKQKFSLGENVNKSQSFLIKNNIERRLHQTI